MSPRRPAAISTPCASSWRVLGLVEPILRAEPNVAEITIKPNSRLTVPSGKFFRLNHIGLVIRSLAHAWGHLMHNRSLETCTASLTVCIRLVDHPFLDACSDNKTTRVCVQPGLDLLTIIKLNGMPNERHNWIFNGDFVDRGQHSAECVLSLFAFKILFPKMVLTKPVVPTCYLLQRSSSLAFSVLILCTFSC